LLFERRVAALRFSRPVTSVASGLLFFAMGLPLPRSPENEGQVGPVGLEYLNAKDVMVTTPLDGGNAINRKADVLARSRRAKSSLDCIE
jgi:hypothetical protein